MFEDLLPVTASALLGEKAAEKEKEAQSDVKLPYNGPPLKYPKSVFFIVTNEFCERFCFYGMRTILALYLVQYLNYNEDNATVVYHAFVSFCYLTPLIGAVIADSWLGRFKTILILSLVYAIGSVSISLSAIPNFIPPEAFTYLGLILIGFGTGGIKPCVSAFGGDQFVVPEQERQLQQFFSIFYFAVNGGSLVSTFLTPILREDVKCFERDDCYSLAFGVPAILMVVSIIIFVAGKPMYKSKKPGGNVMLEVCKCIGHGIKMRFTNKDVKKEHWLEHAEGKYSRKLIDDIKLALNVLVMFIPLLLFWALFDQQGSRWTFQATRMSGDIGAWNIKPDQMQVINPLLIIILIPVFEATVYPLFKKLNILQKPLTKMTFGGMLAAVAFVLSALVELSIKPTEAIVPTAGEAQLRIFNTFNCPMVISAQDNGVTIGEFEIEPLKAYENLYLAAQGNKLFNLNIRRGATCDQSLADVTAPVEIREGTAQSYAIHDGINSTPTIKLSGRIIDDPEKSRNGNGKIKIIINSANTGEKRVVFNGKIDYEFKTFTGEAAVSDLLEMDVDDYTIFLNGEEIGTTTVVAGGVYTYVINENTKAFVRRLVTPENSVNMLWLIPQYFVITAGEVMFSITGLEFAFTQAPLTMKSVIVAGWYLSVAFGNFFVIIIAEVKFVSDQMWEFVLFAVLMAVSMVIFWLMSLKYKYVTIATEDSNDDMAMEKKKSVDNDAFEDHKD
ncbi:solute carrier family 15 member 1-like isoform X2 [Neocloeon triangulifer]|uniref:solute carrier family 15 member 1-like isoform X2 n=1 Tax=Neocloeon triangulifer TaxID=2078957 RepID=UPI00286FADED|nr:solute carrier family 15 member 1-like isoform X2 [Neocloeon triangulifer]